MNASLARTIGALVLALAASAAAVHFGPALAAAMLAPNAGAPAAETMFTIAIFGPLLLVTGAGGLLWQVNPLRLGRHPLLMLVLGALAGLAGVMVTIVYASIAGTLTEGTASGSTARLLLWGLAIVLLQTGAEEVYFRGWLQPVLERGWGIIAGVLVTALAFAALHVIGGARSPVTLVNLFLGGALFGLFAAYGRGIAGALAAHFAWNAAEQLGVGLDPNPGIGSFGALLDLEMAGAQAWGGSSEGLNASVAMTVTLVVMLVPLMWLVMRKRREGAVRTD